MAIKTFTTGEVLTAADTNTYLANSGLVYVASGSTTNTATLVIANCFSATYDAYKLVVWDWFGTTAPTGASIQFTGATTGYYYCTLTVTQAPAVATAVGNNTASLLANSVAGTTGGSGYQMEIQNPFLAKNTTFQVSGTDNRTTGEFIRMTSGYLNNTTSYSGITIGNASGNITAKAAVYGYRLA